MKRSGSQHLRRPSPLIYNPEGQLGRQTQQTQPGTRSVEIGIPDFTGFYQDFQSKPLLRVRHLLPPPHLPDSIRYQNCPFCNEHQLALGPMTPVDFIPTPLFVENPFVIVIISTLHLSDPYFAVFLVFTHFQTRLLPWSHNTKFYPRRHCYYKA